MRVGCAAVRFDPDSPIRQRWRDLQPDAPREAWFAALVRGLGLPVERVGQAPGVDVAWVRKGR